MENDRTHEILKQAKDVDKMNKHREELTQRFLAYLFMENSDQTRHGSLLRHLLSEKSMKDSKYPVALKAA